MNDAEKKALIDELLGSLNSPSNRVQLVQAESPLGISAKCPPHSSVIMTITVMPTDGAEFIVHGVRSLNQRGDVIIHRVCSGSDIPRNAGPFDSAAYSLEHSDFKSAGSGENVAYYKASWGKISKDRPLLITYAPVGYPSVPPSLEWVLFGTLIRHSDIEEPSLLVVEVPNDAKPSDVAESPESKNLWPST